MEPSGVIAIPSGPWPTLISVSSVLLATSITETDAVLKFETYARVPSGENTDSVGLEFEVMEATSVFVAVLTDWMTSELPCAFQVPT